jgi:hypothetical protein
MKIRARTLRFVNKLNAKAKLRARKIFSSSAGQRPTRLINASRQFALFACASSAL